MYNPKAGADYWADAQADLSFCCAHTHFVCFVMSRLTFLFLLSGFVLTCRRAVSPFYSIVAVFFFVDYELSNIVITSLWEEGAGRCLLVYPCFVI